MLQGHVIHCLITFTIHEMMGIIHLGRKRVYKEGNVGFGFWVSLQRQQLYKVQNFSLTIEDTFRI